MASLANLSIVLHIPSLAYMSCFVYREFVSANSAGLRRFGMTINGSNFFFEEVLVGGPEIHSEARAVIFIELILETSSNHSTFLRLHYAVASNSKHA